MLPKTEAVELLSTALAYWKDFGTADVMARNKVAIALYDYLSVEENPTQGLFRRVEERRKLDRRRDNSVDFEKVVSLYEEKQDEE